MTFSVAVICVSLIVVTLIAALIATKRPKNYPPGIIPILHKDSKANAQFECYL